MTESWGEDAPLEDGHAADDDSDAGEAAMEDGYAEAWAYMVYCRV